MPDIPPIERVARGWAEAYNYPGLPVVLMYQYNHFQEVLIIVCEGMVEEWRGAFHGHLLHSRQIDDVVVTIDPRGEEDEDTPMVIAHFHRHGTEIDSFEVNIAAPTGEATHLQLDDKVWTRVDPSEYTFYFSGQGHMVSAHRHL